MVFVSTHNCTWCQKRKNPVALAASTMVGLAWCGGTSEKMQWFCKAELEEWTSRKIAVDLQSGISGTDFQENCKGLQSGL